MKKIIGLVVAVIVIIFIVVNPFKANKLQEKPIVKIGATLPLTGDVAHVGTMVKEAMNLALKDAGDTKYQYELLFEDDQHKQKLAALNVSKFFGVDKISAIISMWDMFSVVSPRAEDAKKIHFACTFGRKAAKGDYNFNVYTQIDEQFNSLYSQIKKDGIKNIAFVLGKYSGSIEQVDDLILLFKNTDIKVMAREEYNPGTKDFRMLIQKLESQNKIDLYYIIGAPPEPFVFVKQYREITGKNNVTSIDGFYEADDKSIFNDMWYIESSFGTDKFKEEFQNKVGHEAQPCSANLYDAVSLLIYGYENTPVKEGELIPDNLDVIKTIKVKDKYDGALGEFTVDDKGLVHSNSYVKKVVNGKAVSLSF